jgi:hypothetical protein
MTTKALAILTLALSPVAPLLGQGTILPQHVYAPVAADFQDCATNKWSPMYYPALYAYPDGSLGMITQGNCLGACDLGMSDSLFRWKRAVNGSWKAASGGLSPSQNPQTLDGQAIPAGALTWFKERFSESPRVDQLACDRKDKVTCNPERCNDCCNTCNTTAQLT